MGAIQTTGSGQVVRSEKKPADQLAGMLAKMGPEMAKALPKHISADRMMRIATTALRTNPKLGECSQFSFLGCVLSAAQLGLEVNTPLGHAYLIPRNSKTGMECTLQVGYQGYLDLARRSGEVASIYAEAVYPGDIFDYERGLNPSLKHKPSEADGREEQRLSHVYAVAKLKSGESIFTVLTRGQVEKYRKRGASGSNAKTPWDTDYEAMAKKTAVRRLFTWIPKSAEVASMVAIDEAPEIGKAQVTAFDPEVTKALETHGIDVALPAHDPETGEIEEPSVPTREPGEEG